MHHNLRSRRPASKRPAVKIRVRVRIRVRVGFDSALHPIAIFTIVRLAIAIFTIVRLAIAIFTIILTILIMLVIYTSLIDCVFEWKYP